MRTAPLVRLAGSIKDHRRQECRGNDLLCPYVKPTKEILKYEEGHKTNYQIAKETAKRYAPNMKVVPVQTFEDAVNYLKTHQ